MTERYSKILLVDVPQRIQTLFESQRTAYSIVVTSNVEDALRQIEEENIKLCVLSDILPDMDAFIRNVRSSPLASDLPLLVITSNRAHEELFKLGADAFFGTNESDARFLEKIELLLGLGDSNKSNVFGKRNELENPYFFVVEYASRMVQGMNNVTPSERERILPDNQSLQSLIQTVEKDVSGNDRHQIAQEFTEGLEAVDPQAYIGQQLSVGERMGIESDDSSYPLRHSDESVERNSHSSSSIFLEQGDISEGNGRSSLFQTTPNRDSDVMHTNVLPTALKHRQGGGGRPSPSSGNTLSQSFSISTGAKSSHIRESLIENLRVRRQRSTSSEGADTIMVASSLPLSPAQSGGIDSPLAGTVTESPVHTDFRERAGESNDIPISVVSPSMVVTPNVGELPMSGQLSDYPVWRIFQSVVDSGFSGDLVVHRKTVERRFYFDSGELMVVSSNAREDRLVELLYREGRISDQQYESASMTIAASGRRAGVVMVEKGIITSRELFPIVRYHYENMLFDTFGWQAGEWQMTAGAYSLNERIVMDTPLSLLILEAFRTVVPAEQIRQIVQDKIPQLNSVLPAVFINRLQLMQIERDLLNLCDGSHSIAWLANCLGMNVNELRSLVAGLMVLGVLNANVPNSEALVSDVSVGEAVLPPGGDHYSHANSDFFQGAGDERLLAEKLAQIAEGSYFEIAEVAEDATVTEIRQSLQRLRSLYTANRFSGIGIADLHEKLGTIGAILDEATDVLLNDEFRDGYRKAIFEMMSSD
ncbi:MAG: response regulator [Deltaproteobacteria bacterium]|nr:response regulator [Deltaproteobacteria bacterium]